MATLSRVRYISDTESESEEEVEEMEEMEEEVVIKESHPVSSSSSSSKHNSETIAACDATHNVPMTSISEEEEQNASLVAIEEESSQVSERGDRDRRQQSADGGDEMGEIEVSGDEEKLGSNVAEELQSATIDMVDTESAPVTIPQNVEMADDEFLIAADTAPAYANLLITQQESEQSMGHEFIQQHHEEHPQMTEDIEEDDFTIISVDKHSGKITMIQESLAVGSEKFEEKLVEDLYPALRQYDLLDETAALEDQMANLSHDNVALLDVDLLPLVKSTARAQYLNQYMINEQTLISTMAHRSNHLLSSGGSHFFKLLQQYYSAKHKLNMKRSELQRIKQDITNSVKFVHITKSHTFDSPPGYCGDETRLVGSVKADLVEVDSASLKRMRTILQNARDKMYKVCGTNANFN